MKKIFAYAALAALFCLPAQAKIVHVPDASPPIGPMVADTSQSSIQIHSSFNGAELLIFGARNVPGDLVIAVHGPSARVTLRRKERIAGMWMHVERHKYPHLPLFYAVAATKPLKEIASASTRYQLGLGEDQVIARSNGSGMAVFDDALRQMMHARHRWQEPFAPITYFGESLFKARLALPSNMPRGNYSIEVYLFDHGKPVAFQTIPLSAFKTGMDARIYDESRNAPWLYGILAIAMALAGGWLAHRLFHKN